MMLTAAQAAQRRDPRHVEWGRKGALKMHAAGKTNTRPATAAHLAALEAAGVERSEHMRAVAMHRWHGKA